MRALSGQEILHIWELGLKQHPIDRALTILAVASPEMSQDELATLSLGQRDARLLSVRERTFGPRVAGLAECPKCQGKLEFFLDVSDIRMAPDKNNNNTDQFQQLTADSFELRFRLPNSLDLKAIASCRDVVAAHNLLVRRCLLQTCQDGVEVPVEDLPETTIAALAAQIAEHDPQAEVELELNCPACRHRWQIIFDIASFFWNEICIQAKRLLRQVHTLARAYGWREADILAMSAARRQFYLEMVT